MTTLTAIALSIIREQELVIGPLAWGEAKKVKGISVNPDKTVTLETGNEMQIIDNLVAQYERLFGRASHEVCRDAAASLIRDLSPAEVPSSLR